MRGMSSKEDQLAALLLRWEEAWEHDEDVPAAELCVENPDLADQLQAQIDVLKKMAWMKNDAAEVLPANGSTDAPLIGKTLAGRYRIDQFVGEGGFGQVYRAFDSELQRQVAVKVAHHHVQETDALLQEARRVAQLRHPGIVAVHDVVRDDQTVFVVSDLIEGHSLAQLLQSGLPDPCRSAKLVAEIAEALHFAHEQGFVHRDIKPANILIDKQDHPLVADFGIAATAEELAQGERLSSGTLPYMAPEQLAGEAQLIDARTDVYALGVVLYEMLTGHQPHSARTPTALREQILFRAPVAFDAPAEIREVCLRCLAKHPADRYPSAQALAEALREAHVRPRRWRIPVLGLLLVALALSVVAGVRYLPPLLVKAEPLAIFLRDGTFVFDGTNRIVTPVEPFAPVTLEAWVRPERYEQRCHFVIGSDIPSEHGIGLGMAGVLLACEYVPGLYQSMQVVPLREWSHIAAVFGEKDTKLFFNGKLVGTGPATQIKGGTPFVIGNVGYRNPIDYFVGEIRTVRISRGERYQGDFAPESEFVKDADDAPCKAVLIYDGRAVEDGKVVDLSGNRNHGTPQPSLP